MSEQEYKLEPFSTSSLQIIGTVYRVILQEGLEETSIAYFKEKSDAELFMEMKKKNP